MKYVFQNLRIGPRKIPDIEKSQIFCIEVFSKFALSTTQSPLLRIGKTRSVSQFFGYFLGSSGLQRRCCLRGNRIGKKKSLQSRSKNNLWKQSFAHNMCHCHAVQSEKSSTTASAVHCQKNNKAKSSLDQMIESPFSLYLAILLVHRRFQSFSKMDNFNI